MRKPVGLTRGSAGTPVAMLESKVSDAREVAVLALSPSLPTLRAAGRARSLPDDCFRATAVSTSLDWLLDAQTSSDIYFYLPRADCARLSGLVGDWPAHGLAVRNLLAAKLRRALVRDPDRMPYDVVTIGAQVDYCVNGSDLKVCLLDSPDSSRDLDDGVPVTSAIGALLLGLTECGTLRQHAPDGAVLTFQVKKVRQPRSVPHRVLCR